MGKALVTVTGRILHPATYLDVYYYCTCSEPGWVLGFGSISFESKRVGGRANLQSAYLLAWECMTIGALGSSLRLGGMVWIPNWPFTDIERSHFIGFV